eukprot:1178982-Prorocentrum_minimum.AAC.1
MPIPSTPTPIPSTPTPIPSTPTPIPSTPNASNVTLEMRSVARPSPARAARLLGPSRSSISSSKALCRARNLGSCSCAARAAAASLRACEHPTQSEGLLSRTLKP